MQREIARDRQQLIPSRHLKRKQEPRPLYIPRYTTRRAYDTFARDNRIEHRHFVATEARAPPFASLYISAIADYLSVLIMAVPQIEAGSALAQSIQNQVQAKVVEQGWAEESDVTLSEYVLTMLVEGKDQQSVKAEIGGDLLGLPEDDPQVAEFANWLFEHLRSIAAGQQSQQQGGAQQAQQAQAGQDTQMDDATAPVDGA